MVGLFWFGLVWFGLVCFVLILVGVVWFALKLSSGAFPLPRGGSQPRDICLNYMV